MTGEDTADAWLYGEPRPEKNSQFAGARAEELGRSLGITPLDF